MSIFRLSVGAMSAAATALLLTGCIDQDYDLADLDTTTELKANDLVLPLNIQSITLDDVLDLDDDDPDATIKKMTIDGQDYFVIEKRGNFHSDPTTIKTIKAPRPNPIDPIRQVLPGSPNGTAIDYQIAKDETDFVYEVGRNGSEKVDESIKTVHRIKMSDDKLVMNITLSSSDLQGSADHIIFTNLKLRLPEGMHAASSQGTIEGNILTIPVLEGSGNQAKVVVVSDDIDFRPEYGADGIEVVDGEFTYGGKLGVESGIMTAYPRSGQSCPTSCSFTIDYDLSSFIVTKFTGNIEYINNIANFDPVYFDDLPDFLAGDETNLIMSNPQLVLTVSNPAGEYGLTYYSGVTIDAFRDDMVSRSEILPGNIYVGCDHGEGPYEIVLAPRPDDAIDVAPSQARENFVYPGLGHVLEGNGLPQRIEVNMASPSMPESVVKGVAVDYPLGEELHDVNGSYTFLSLLSLMDGSKIVYQKTNDGWNDEDVDAIAISEMTVTATVTTDVPAAVTLWARPIDTAGKVIEISNPEDGQVSVSPMSNAEPFVLTFKGDIRHLDGIRFIATAADFDGEPLLPGQTIEINDLRVKVNGTYTKEL